MKRTGTFLLFVFLCAGIVYGAPRIKIVTSYVTPYTYSQTPGLTADSTVATGLRTAPKGTYVYFRAWNWGDAAAIQSATWSFVSKPSGSTATLSTITGLNWWSKFKIDLTGTYVINVSVVTSTGTKDTTETIYGATYVGVGGYDGLPAAYPNCMTCHEGNEPFQTIFNKWKVSGHGTKFKRDITTGSPTYSTSCIKCHTVGYDQTIFAINGGFDDRARDLGWNWSNYSPPKPSNWDTLRNRFPSLVQFATIGCENCHGPGSEHVAGGGDTNKIQISVNEGACLKCHDAPTHHIYGRQFSNALHSKVVYSSSFAQQNNGSNNLGNCIRCHDGNGYVNYTKGEGTNTNNYNVSKQENITCATCHDPHGDNGIDHQIRSRQPNSDTLANGYQVTVAGTGVVCMDCHKSREDVRVAVNTRVTNSRYGPHHGPQTDLYEGQIGATFGGAPYRSTQHFSFLQDACVTCHMAADTTSANKYNVGGHSWNMHNDSTNYDNTNGCKTCHAGKTRFDQFIADQDYDQNGTIEAWQTEVNGCLTKLRIQLPPVGVDSVAWQLVAADSNNVTLRKAYWNYVTVTEDKSLGIHNPKYTIDMLVQSRGALIGILPISNEVPIKFELTQNYPNPFNPTTKFKFSLPKESDVTIVVYDIMGRVVNVLANSKYLAGIYEVDWNGRNSMNSNVASGVYFYKIVAGNYTDVKKMIMLK